MATYDGKFLKGAIGNVSFRVFGGKSVVQTKPGKGNVKQTKGSVTASIQFGIASTAAKSIRTVLLPAFNGCYDSGMINRMNSVAAALFRRNHNVNSPGIPELGNAELLNNFEFNNSSPLLRTLPVLPDMQVTDNRIKVAFKGFRASDLKGPAGWERCTIRLFTSVMDFNNGIYRHFIDTGIELSTTAEFQGENWESEDALPGNCLVTLAVSAEFYTNSSGKDIFLNTKGYYPAAIVRALKSNQAHTEKSGEWNNMNNFAVKNHRLEEKLLKKLKKAR